MHGRSARRAFESDFGALCPGSAAITPREVERTREGREEVVVWEKRRRRTGLCHYSEYYVGRPSTRAATTTVKETVFDANPSQIRVR